MGASASVDANGGFCEEVIREAIAQYEEKKYEQTTNIITSLRAILEKGEITAASSLDTSNSQWLGGDESSSLGSTLHSTLDGDNEIESKGNTIAELAASHILHRSKSFRNTSFKGTKKQTTKIDEEEPLNLASLLPPPRISFDEENAAAPQVKAKFGGIKLSIELTNDTSSKTDGHEPFALGSESGAIRLENFNINKVGLLNPTSHNEQLTTNNPVDFYQIKELGRGAGGAVNLFLHRPTMSLVAIKSIAMNSDAKRSQTAIELKVLYQNLADISPKNMNDPSSTFQIGKQDAPSIRSDEIVKFYDCYSNNGNINIVLEYVSGGTLQDLINRGGSRSESVLQKIALSAVKGLLFLHNRKLMHRDIKPNNILLSLDGRVRLADFGISKELDNSASKDFASTFIGTFLYMSPERILGEQYCSKSDCWGFGLTLLSVALGKYPIAISSQNNAYWEVYDSLQSGGSGGGGLEFEGQLRGENFSESFIDFLNCCLHFDVSLRKSTKELLDHEFLRGMAEEVSSDTSNTWLRAAKESELEEILEVCQNIHSMEFSPEEPFGVLAAQLGLDEAYVKSRLVKYV